MHTIFKKKKKILRFFLQWGTHRGLNEKKNDRKIIKEEDRYPFCKRDVNFIIRFIQYILSRSISLFEMQNCIFRRYFIDIYDYLQFSELLISTRVLIGRLQNIRDEYFQYWKYHHRHEMLCHVEKFRVRRRNEDIQSHHCFMIKKNKEYNIDIDIT